ncbi:MAG: NTP transferase domain-containing protein, partial [Chloroflexota bacterium]|nr:NTP transferase domain-containing protein [Chloroflexota bacterium]
MISAILLAAGESKRMGKPKQLMPWHQGTILERAIDNLLESAVNEVVVVVGYQAEEVVKVIAARPVAVAVNPDYE